MLRPIVVSRGEMDREHGAPADMPVELVEAFGQSEEVRDIFETLPPSHQREYIEWVAEAKKPETRTDRARRTIERILEDRGTE